VVREPIYKAWEEFLDDWKQNKAPEGLKNCFQIADYFWAFIDGERALQEGALNGIVVSLSLAFVILILATMNIYIALYAIISVGCICSNMVAIMVFLDWQLGVSESIAMVIIIGFSVDYVVHLAAHYVHSSQSTRDGRATEAIRDMGVSIFSGGITTLGCGSFIYLCGFKLIVQFATIMTTTVILSLIYAFFFFMSILHAIGPENNSGNLNCCKRRVKPTMV